MEGLDDIDWDALFSTPSDYWQDEIRESINFLDKQVGIDLPEVIKNELKEQAFRIATM